MEISALFYKFERTRCVRHHASQVLVMDVVAHIDFAGFQKLSFYVGSITTGCDID